MKIDEVDAFSEGASIAVPPSRVQVALSMTLSLSALIIGLISLWIQRPGESLNDQNLIWSINYAFLAMCGLLISCYLLVRRRKFLLLANGFAMDLEILVESRGDEQGSSRPRSVKQSAKAAMAEAILWRDALLVSRDMKVADRIQASLRFLAASVGPLPPQVIMT